jgi:hypothetical protein
MDKRILSKKSIAGSLLRIAMLLVITVGGLFFLTIIFSAINGDFPPARSNVKHASLKFDPRLLNGFGEARHVDVKKPPLLESIKDMYMGWKYGTDYFIAKYNNQNRHDKAKFTEKIFVVNPLTNWDKKLVDFCKNTGFIGKIDNEEIKKSNTWKERNFQVMEGRFTLAEPKDTVSFRRNADFLVKNILEIFEGEKAKFNLSKQPIYEEPRYYLHGSKKVFGYHAYYEQLLEQKIPHQSEFSIDPRLNISYNVKAKNYQISNLLFAIPSLSPQDKVGKQAALKLARKTVQKRNKLPASVCDTLSAEMWKGYIVRYPETKSPYYYYVQSVWYVNFPWALYDSTFVGFDITYNEVYAVDAFNGQVSWYE